ncbi:MAG: DUF1080 domain-containing protein [Bacteroidota bacterium]
MKAFPLLLLSLCLLACQSTFNTNPDASVEAWQALFNGENLEGWDIKITGHPLGENYLNTFRVQDSMIRISYDDYEEFGLLYGHMYYQEPFSHYRLKFEYRFVGEQTPGGAPWNVRNSGVMLHSQSAASVGIDQHFPVSIELQTLGGLGEEERTTSNLCTPGTMVVMGDTINRTHCINSTSKTYHGDQWVSVEAVVLGDSIVHHIMEGDTVLTYEKPMIDGIFVNEEQYNWEQAGVPDPESWQAKEATTLQEGYIALQAESHPIDFRNIQLLNLAGCKDPKAKNYKSYLVKHLPERCEY